MKILEEGFYIDWDGSIQVDMDMLLISIWNVDAENKISLNNKEFFENSFNNALDAAQAVSKGSWKWTDTFVCFDGEGHLTSFNHWNDETSPIDLDKINISPLIDGLKKFHKKNKRYVIHIPSAIHDALQEG